MIQNTAVFGARSQAKKGFNYGEVFGRIWFSKLQRLGFLRDLPELEGNHDSQARRKTGTARRLYLATT